MQQEKRQEKGASSCEDRAVVNGAGQAGSAVPASVPSVEQPLYVHHEHQTAWCVWTKTGRRPQFWHDTREGAEAEAERLARKHPGKTFIVFEKLVNIKALPDADLTSSAHGFRVGDRVFHTSSTGDMGAGTVTSIADGDVRVRYDKVGQFGRISSGVYGDHWFRTANAKLLRVPAKAIEARQGGDGEAGSIEDESAVPEGCALTPSQATGA